MKERPSWHEYFMKMAKLAAERSTCTRRQVGAVLVRNNQVIASGFNGAPKHILHCDTTGCIREQLNVPPGEKHELCRGVHAEQNTIIQAALNRSTLADSVLYCTNYPCAICAKMIINAEIKIVYVLEHYPDNLAKELFAEAGIEVLFVDMKNKSVVKM